jgi:hypothetical protein
MDDKKKLDKKWNLSKAILCLKETFTELWYEGNGTLTQGAYNPKMVCSRWVQPQDDSLDMSTTSRWFIGDECSLKQHNNHTVCILRDKTNSG